MSMPLTAPLFLSNQCGTSPLILVIEDDPVLGDLMKMLLSEEAPYQVIVAVSAQAALEQAVSLCARRKLPALLLLDYQIGLGMTGIDLYDRLRLLPGWATIPAMMISANLPRAHIQARGLRSLSKPFEVDDLLQMVSAVLGVPQPA